MEDATYQRILALPGSFPLALYIDYMVNTDGSYYMEYIDSDNHVLATFTRKSLTL